MYSGLHPCEQSAKENRPSGLTGYHLEDGKADPDEEINYDTATLLRGCDRHNFYRSNLI
jgi:hypothetical protein